MRFTALTSLLPSTLTAGEITRCNRTMDGVQLAIGRALPWGEAFDALRWPHDTALICDNRTWQAAGETIVQALQSGGRRVTLLNLGSAPKATQQHIAYIREHAADCAAFIAVGSGTLNDLTKYAAHLSGKPYAVCGTAPSMNGYLSANAAITVDGHKQSLPAALPCAALFDLDVLEAAPESLRRAGVGDSICRPTAQADWLLSHWLLDTPYDPLPFKLLAPYEADMLAGDMEALITTLLLSGVGMTLCRGSYPASQGEHLLAHYMDMRYPEAAEQAYHGEHIAVTSLFMATLQQQMLSLPHAPQWVMETVPDETYCHRHFGEGTGAQVWKEWSAKLDAIGGRERLNKRLTENWREIRSDIGRICIPVARLLTTLETTNAPQKVQQIGWTKEQFTEAAHHAYLIRNRFTFLDLGVLASFMIHSSSA